MSRPDELVDSLRNPDRYPHPVEGEVRVVHTHISIVLLTGSFAYKIKKPVDLGFLDYSTLERRRMFCEREIEINSRSAPDIYIEAVPVYRTSNGFSLIADTGDATIAEYAVKMHQFNEPDILLNRFRDGKLGPADMVHLGQVIARTHARAPRSDPDSRFGSAADLRNVAAANFEKVRPHLGQTIDRDHLDAIESGTLAAIGRHAEFINRRKREGFVRECHGDLHMNNVCIFKNRFQLFDGIEFNDDFSRIDLFYDLAFLLMDLKFRGAPEFANIVLNAYAEVTGDYPGTQLLPLFRSMRAFIRGEVQSILSSEHEVPQPQRADAAAEAARFFELAHDELLPARGRVIVMCGVSGSGKSWLAARLAPKLDAIRIRSDALRKHLAGVPLEERGANIYTPEHTARTYTRLAELGTTLAATGENVILDATYLTQAQRELAIRPAAEAGLETCIVHCTAAQDTLEARIAARTEDVSDATAALLPDQLRRLEAPDETENARLLRIETDSEPRIAGIAARIRRPDRSSA